MSAIVYSSFVKSICIVIYFLTKITNKIEFRETVEGSNWHDFYSDQVAQKKLTEFKKFLSIAIQKHALMRKIFVRNETPLFFLTNLSLRQREKKIKADRLLTECELINFGKNKNTGFEILWFLLFRKQLIQTSKSERLKWNWLDDVEFAVKQPHLWKFQNLIRWSFNRAKNSKSLELYHWQTRRRYSTGSSLKAKFRATCKK